MVQYFKYLKNSFHLFYLNLVQKSISESMIHKNVQSIKDEYT